MDELTAEELVFGKQANGGKEKTNNQELTPEEIVFGKSLPVAAPVQPKVEEPGLLSKIGRMVKGALNSDIMNLPEKAMRAITEFDPSRIMKEVGNTLNGVPAVQGAGAVDEWGRTRNTPADKPYVPPPPPVMSAVKKRTDPITDYKKIPLRAKVNTAEEVLSQFFGSAADSLVDIVRMPGDMTGLYHIPSAAPTNQGVGTGAGVAGRVVGSIPTLSYVMKGFHVLTNEAILAVKALGPGAQAIVADTIKAYFTYDIGKNFVNNAKMLIESFNTDDFDMKRDALAGLLFDTVFGVLVNKQNFKDAKALKASIDAWKARKGTDSAKPVDVNIPPIEPSPELQKAADTAEIKPEVKDVTEKINKKRTKKERTPEQIEADKQRMAALRAKRKNAKVEQVEKPVEASVEGKVEERELTAEEIVFGKEEEDLKPYVPQPLSPKQRRLAIMRIKNGEDIDQVAFRLDVYESELRKDAEIMKALEDRSKIQRSTETPVEEKPTEAIKEETKTEESKAEEELVSEKVEEEKPIEEPGTEEPTEEELAAMRELEIELAEEGTPDKSGFRGAFAKRQVEQADRLVKIAQETGKRVEELTEEDIAKYEEPLARPVEDVDIDTGTPDPVKVDETSPFRTESDITKAQANNYKRNSAVANDVEELAGGEKSAMVTSHKLANDINRFLDGDGTVDVEKTRGFLSELSARAEEFKWQFVDEYGSIDEAAFREWKQYVNELSTWARSERGNVVQWLDGTLNMFIDPMKAPALVKDLFTKMKPIVGKTIEEIYKATGFFLNPYDRGWRYEIDDSKMEWKIKFEDLPTSQSFSIIGPITPTIEYKLTDIIDHPTLFDAYPELRDVKFTKKSSPFNPMIQGWFDSNTKVLNISPTATNPKETAIHEIQHWIQWKEGWAQGGNTKDAIQLANLNNLIALGKRVADGLETDISLKEYELRKISDDLALVDRVIDNTEAQLINYEYVKNWKYTVKQHQKFQADPANKGTNFFDTGEGKRLSQVQDDLLAKFKKATNLDTYEAIKTLAISKYGKSPDFREARLEIEGELKTAQKKLTDLKTLEIELQDATDTDKLRTRIASTADGSFQAYSNLAGEIEARDAAARMDYSMADRMEITPLRSQPHDPNEVIIHYGTRQSASEVRLNSGLPIDQIFTSSKVVADYISNAYRHKGIVYKELAKLIKESGMRNIVDISGNIKQKLIEKAGESGYWQVINLVNSKGGVAFAQEMYKQATHEIFGKLTKRQEMILDTLIHARRMKAIASSPSGKSFKFPDGSRPEEAEKALEDFNKFAKAYPEEANDLLGRVESYFEWMRKVNQDLFDAELIGEQELSDLNSYEYRRIHRIDQIYDRVLEDTKVKGRSVYDSGVEYLAKGKRTDIYEPSSRVMMAEVMSRVYGRIYKNKAFKELYEFGKADQNNEFARVKVRDNEVAGEQATNRRGLIDSIQIKRELRGLSDFEYRSKMKELFKTSSMKKLTNEQLAEFDRSLGDTFYKYKKAKKGEGFKVPAGWKSLYGYIRGERKTIRISPEMYEEWIMSRPEMTYKLAQTIRWLNGSQLLKTFATGINWAFAVRNLPRDIMHIWFSARQFTDGKWESVYSSHAPKFAMDMGADMVRTFKDAATRGPKWTDALEDGIGMGWLTLEGRPFRRGKYVDGNMSKIMDILGYFGETSEIWTRLALRDRVIRNRAAEKGISYEEAYKDRRIRQEATFAARDYMDFSQGGSMTKALDVWIPYLNATVQGTRGMVRAFGKDTRLSTMYKMSQLALVVTGVYLARQHMSPEAHEQIKNSQDDINNLCIPLSKEYAVVIDGQKVYPYIKIPLDNSQRFFKAVFEAGADYMQGIEPNVKKIRDAFKDLNPVGLGSLPPIISAPLGYFGNYDLWKLDDVWKGSDGKLKWPQSKAEYIPGKTPQAYVDFGQLTGLSPERTKYVAKELFSTGGEWAVLAEAGYKELKGVPRSQKEQHIAEVLTKIPMTAAVVGLTNPYMQYVDMINAEKDNYRFERQLQNVGMDARIYDYLDKKVINYNQVMDYIYEYKDKEVRQRLRDRFKFAEATKELPNRSFWMALRGTPTEVRAAIYLNRTDKLNNEEYNKLKNEEALVRRAEKRISSPQFSIFTEEFKKALSKAKREKTVK